MMTFREIKAEIKAALDDPDTHKDIMQHANMAMRRMCQPCRHEYQWTRNIYGDEINAADGMRSVWACKYCHHAQYRKTIKVIKCYTRKGMTVYPA